MKQEMIEKAVIQLLYKCGYSDTDHTGAEIEPSVDSILGADLGMDSLDVTYLGGKAEQRFDITIPDDIVAQWKEKSIRDVACNIKTIMDTYNRIHDGEQETAEQPS